VCVGAFLLAEAGLLDGRRVVTHWMHCGLLASSYPDVTVEPDAIYIRDAVQTVSASRDGEAVAIRLTRYRDVDLRALCVRKVDPRLTRHTRTCVLRLQLWQV
jgi:hypothetical protein